MRLNDCEAAEGRAGAGAREAAEAFIRAAEATAAAEERLTLGVAAASRADRVGRTQDGDAAGSSDADTATSTTVAITLSHFLPHPGLPFCRHTPELAKAVGCQQLQHLLRRLGAAVHVYGHTHVEYDGELRDTCGQGAADAGPGAGQMAAAGNGPPGGSCDMGCEQVGGEGVRGPPAAAGEGRKEGRAVCGVARGVGEGNCRRYVHRALHGRDRVVLRCVWDGGRGLCGYDVEGEGEREEGEVDSEVART